MASVTFPMALETIAWVKDVAKEQFVESSVLDLLCDWERGVKKPTLSQVQKLGQRLHIPFGYFFLTKRPVEHFKILEFRTIDSVAHGEASPQLKDTIAQMEAVQDWVREYRRGEAYPKVAFVGRCRGMDVSQVLVTVRDVFEIPVHWYADVKDAEQAFRFFRRLCEQQGIIVMQNGVVGNNTHRPLSLDEFRAFVLTDDWAPLIFINARDGIRGRLFSLLHEVVHVFLGQNDLFNSPDRVTAFEKEIERICNRVAAEILAPKKEFLEIWAQCSREKDLQFSVKQAAKKFHCSLTVAARRALDLGCITQGQYEEMVSLFQKAFAKGKGKGGNYYNTLASRMDGPFVRMLADSVQMGNTTYTEAFRLTGTNNKTFAELVKDVSRGGRRA